MSKQNKSGVGHTPIPWRVWHRDASAGGPLITDRDGYLGIARVLCRLDTDKKADRPLAREANENADRIVAAVNGCEGIPTEALEGGVVAELVAACVAALPQMEKALAIRQKLIGDHQGGIAATVSLIKSALRKAGK